MEKEIYLPIAHTRPIVGFFSFSFFPDPTHKLGFFFSSFPSAVLKRGAHNVTNAFFLFLVLSTRHLPSGQQTHERVLSGGWLVVLDFCLTSVFIP